MLEIGFYLITYFSFLWLKLFSEKEICSSSCLCSSSYRLFIFLLVVYKTLIFQPIFNNLIVMRLSKVFLHLFCLKTCWVSWISEFMVFIKFGQFIDITSSNIFYPHPTSPFETAIFTHCTVLYCLADQCSFSFFLFCLCDSIWIDSLAIPSNPQIFSSVSNMVLI